MSDALTESFYNCLRGMSPDKMIEYVQDFGEDVSIDWYRCELCQKSGSMYRISIHDRGYQEDWDYDTDDVCEKICVNIETMEVFRCYGGSKPKDLMDWLCDWMLTDKETLWTYFTKRLIEEV